MALKGCASPITIGDGDYVRNVSCGRCRYCRIKRKSHWKLRLLLEHQDHIGARFLTLTYSEDPGKLDKKDFQDFMKRYRYHYGECRYFACGEYGEKRKRGHWHAIIFGHQPQTVGHFPDNLAWEHGFSYDGTVTPASLDYVSGYVLKNTDPSEYRPVTMCSLRPGIGFRRLERFGADAARYYQSTPLDKWPAYASTGGKKYWLGDGLVAFKRGFIDAGGIEPASVDPSELHYLAMYQNGQFGDRIKKERNENIRYKRDAGKAGLQENKR